MFIKAIEEVDKFTRPLHTIVRNYGGLISPGTSTFFFVNVYPFASAGTDG